eukprot:jgi/Botrbrau1/9445/Bobra.0252s0068.2
MPTRTSSCGTGGRGTVLLQLHHRYFSRETWPALHLLPNEETAFILMGGSVNIYDLNRAAEGVVAKLVVKGLGSFAVSPVVDGPLIAGAIPEAKGSPGFVGIWPVSSLSKKPEAPAPLARRSFFRASHVRLLWNCKGSAVLALTASDTDATNQSYYGEQKLHFLAADGRNDCLVPLPKDGPIHDVQWSPQGNLFATVAGFMPAKATLFNEKCEPVCDLGAGPHNLVRWNPQGRFIALAGFGNLPGDVALFDRKDNKCTLMGSTRVENGVTAEWSPDGRLIAVATTAPRLRVDNKVCLLRYTGEELETRKEQVLLEAVWRPAPEGAFPDLPQSPRAGGTAAPAAAPAPKAGYVAPHLRGREGASSGGHFSLAREAAGPGRLGGPPARSLPPGAVAPESKPLSKNAKKRRNKKSGKPDGDAEADGEPDGEPEQESPSAPDPAPGVAALSLGGGPQPSGVAEAGGPADREKRLRNLQKKLRQIEQLKEKLASGAALEPEQVAKIGGEAALKAEIQQLESAP